MIPIIPLPILSDEEPNIDLLYSVLIKVAEFAPGKAGFRQLGKGVLVRNHEEDLAGSLILRLRGHFRFSIVTCFITGILPERTLESIVAHY